MLRKYYLELLLILAVVTLIGQITWPTVARWWRRPVPGTVGTDEFKSRSPLASEYAIYLPADYDDSSQHWPLVIFLHGAGERGDNPWRLRDSGPFRAIKEGTRLPAVVVAPQCVANASWEPEALVDFIDFTASRYRVDRDRIYLVGYSMGGYGTWVTATAHPKLFTAIVPISGGGNPENAASLANVPTWAFHGAEDDVVPLFESQRMIDAIRAAGGQPKLSILSGAGHGICDDVCAQRELWDWLLHQKAPSH